MPLVTRTYLALTSLAQLKAADAPGGELTLMREAGCSAALYRRLYALVGEGYHWLDRLSWSDRQLAAHLAEPGVEIWVLREGAALGGYFELVSRHDDSVEIAYFGLAPGFLGRGAGKWLLTRAVQQAFERAPSRVWLHTCTLDHVSALPNYLARGFEPYRTETYEIEAAPV